jgi:protein-tyrosine-phosphatase
VIKSKMLFLCSGNPCRTQMAEAFLRDAAGDRFSVIRAGGDPTQLHPEAVVAMREVGIETSGQTPKDVSRFSVSGSPISFHCATSNRNALVRFLQEPFGGSNGILTPLSREITGRRYVASGISFGSAASNLS